MNLEKNVIPELISDDDFQKVKPFLNKTAVRDFVIRREFDKQRQSGVSLNSIFKNIAREYGLQSDSVRKICYKKVDF
jgi:hypothetical protein